MRGLNHLRISAVLVAAFLAVGQLPASAQDAAANPFTGKWSVEWENGSRPQAADLEITASGGLWKTLATKRSDPCVGREAPLAITTSTADKLDFVIKFSDALQGCKDSKVSLMLDADGKVTGQRGGYALALKRK